MPVTKVKSRWTAGVLEFVDASGNVIISFDGPNRKVLIPSGSALEVDGLGLSTTELGLLDGATAGSITASKVVSRTASQGIPFAAAVVAAIGANASNGAALTKDVNLVTGADNTTCVVLPVGVAGEVIRIVNTVANKVLPVFPNGTEDINGGGAGVVFTMGPARAATFICTAAGVWYVDKLAAATPNATELALLTGAGAGGTPVASKVQVADANQNIGAVKATSLAIGASGAEVSVSATPAELNALASAASGLGSSNGYVRTDNGTKTLVAAHATKDRGVLVVVTVDTAFDTGDGSAPVVTIGETDTPNKGMVNTVLVHGVAAGTRFVFGFTNTATKAITATLTAATGATSTGAYSILIMALPNS